VDLVVFQREMHTFLKEKKMESRRVIQRKIEDLK